MKASLTRAAVFVSGLAGVVGGVAMWSTPAALITGGSLLVGGAVLLEVNDMRGGKP